MRVSGGNSSWSEEKWPTGHFSWVFDGRGGFEGGATSFLAAGAARGERVMFVCDDPKPELWPQPLIEQGKLVVASTSEIYGAARIVAAKSQREIFTSALADALSEGHTGIRLATDCTSLIEGRERLEAWIKWEHEADEFISENPVTGMCAFDASRADQRVISQALGTHSITA